MKLKGDSVTSSIGIVGAILFLQQSYYPELIPEEVVIPIIASLLGGYGVATNKEEIEIPFTEDTKKKKRICELEAEIAQLKAELEASRLLYPEEENEQDKHT